ncbi:MAG: arsenical-resistance protein, partial [Rhodobacteraceae bacterium]|nr:arsenical-resistance protein [Paracoccaceae bacterium]
MSDASCTAPAPMGRFERFLTLWVALAMVGGIALGLVAPGLMGA